MTDPTDCFLNPRSIAVYGASHHASSPGTHIFRNLTSQGFAGAVYPINPKYETLNARPCAPSQEAAGHHADLAVIAIPPAAVPTALRDCSAVGTRAAIVITAGFEDGDGPASRDRLLATAKAGNIRIMGPNCLGIVRPHLALNATFQPALPPVGGLALISQSGALCSALADMAEYAGLGFSLMLSLGNSFDIGLGDAISMAGDDPHTHVVLAYVEGVRNGARFMSALREVSARKPVIVLKAGRHASGAAAAATHTGALVGSDATFSAVLRETGAVQVSTLGELIDVARLFARSVPVTGPRLAIVTNGGGAGVLTADRLSDQNLPVAPLPDAVRARLDGKLSPNWSRRNPLDIVGDATAAQYKETLKACIESPDFDAILTLLSPQSMTAPDLVADAILSAHHRALKPVMSCLLGGSTVASARHKLRRHGVPDYDTPEDAVRAFARAVDIAARPARTETPQLGRKVPEDLSRHLAAFGDLGNGMLSDTASRRLLAAAGIPCPIPELAATADEAVARFKAIGGPVVLKIASPQISHKSEVDGVRLNLRTEAEVRDAFSGICLRTQQLRPDAQILGATVEPLIAPDHPREILVGVTTDPAFGKVITFGAGGTLVELLSDVATALLPLTPDRARGMIAETKISRLLGAYRNMPAVDQDALVDALLHVSDLCAALPAIESLDINPLVAAPSGVTAVDARIRLASAERPRLLP